MPKSGRPVVFVGSSSEGLLVAEALQRNLDHAAEVIVWSQGVFGLSVGSLESLVARASDFDFAVLVLTPDDLTRSRGGEAASPRDNVVFELGFFMGALGRERTFIVHDRTAELRLPSDLAGITPGTYEPPAAGSLQSALGACSSGIQEVVRTLGPRPRSHPEPPIDAGAQFRVVADLLELTARQFIILMHTGSNLQREGRYSLGPRYEYGTEDHSYGHGGFDVDQFCSRLADAGLLTIDLRGRVGLSERGHAFAEWLTESGYKAAYFWSDVGAWGERPIKMRGAPHPTTFPRSIPEMQARAFEANLAQAEAIRRQVEAEQARVRAEMVRFENPSQVSDSTAERVRVDAQQSPVTETDGI